MAVKPKYEMDPDGMLRDIAGAWGKEKHNLLRAYVEITRAVRKDYRETAYIDLFCATGRTRWRDTDEVVDGSSLVASKAAAENGLPFRHVHVADINEGNLAACGARLRRAGITGVEEHHGPAVETVHQVVKSLDPWGLYIAFLDPFALGPLPFDVVRVLGKLKRMDLIIHISEQDMQRSAIGKHDDDVLEAFAPGCLPAVHAAHSMLEKKIAVLEQWKANLRDMSYKVRDDMTRVRGDQNQPLYWLAFASKSDLGKKLWGAISKSPQGSLFG